MNPTPTHEADPASDDLIPADVVVRVDGPSAPIRREVFGTNLPAWLGPSTLRDPAFVDKVLESGVTIVRMPGGSWSNGYDWSACETGGEGCFWTWAARPTDFADFLASSGLSGMWTTSINATAESAAAAVAFFNGSIDDVRPIGVDRFGIDWGTVASWAEVRAEGGHPEPVRIDWWEIGNEVYGGRPEAGGDQCASFGWEDVWTCDGTEYALGDAEHDGFLAIAAAMREVDHDIRIGAVGVGRPADWSDWGNKVIAAAGHDMDFYSVHQYGFDQSPSGADAALRPADLWPDLLAASYAALPADVDIGVTEYNLVAFEAADVERTMTRAANALFLADTIGQLIVGGVAVANQWNVANGITESGTDYGMIDLRDGSSFPQFEAMRIWSQVGTKLLEVERNPDVEDSLRLYATSSEHSLALVVLNLSEDAEDVRIRVDAPGSVEAAEFEGVRAERLDSDEVTVGPLVSVGVAGDVVGPLTLPPWTFGLLKVALGE